MSLKIVGPGHLGLRVAVLWKRLNPDATIHLQGRNDRPDRTSRWEDAGFLSAPSTGSRADHVVFCVPVPRGGGGEEYVGVLRDTLDTCWTGAGSFIFTGSSSVFREDSGGIVTERSVIVNMLEVGTGAGAPPQSSGTLLQCEKLTVGAGGTVLRLGGLYTRNRGPHNYWVRTATSLPASPGGLINLLHYDDAARAVVTAMRKTVPGVFVLSDGCPMSRQEILDSARKCPDYAEDGEKILEFTGPRDKIEGKKLDSSHFRETFQWKPEFESFGKFMAEGEYERELNVASLM